jgi:hypothetical protein
MAGPARFERATLCLEGRCSIHLSYGPVHLFYQRNRNTSLKLCNVGGGGSWGVHVFDRFAERLGVFSLEKPLLISVNDLFKIVLIVNTPLLTYFHLSNARQNQTFYDIVLVIDAYRLFQIMTPVRAGRFSSRERRISETCFSR